MRMAWEGCAAELRLCFQPCCAPSMYPSLLTSRPTASRRRDSRRTMGKITRPAQMVLTESESCRENCREILAVDRCRPPSTAGLQYNRLSTWGLERLYSLQRSTAALQSTALHQSTVYSTLLHPSDCYWCWFAKNNETSAVGGEPRLPDRPNRSGRRPYTLCEAEGRGQWGEHGQPPEHAINFVSKSLGFST